MQGARPHFCLASGDFVGLLYSGVQYQDLDRLRCPWCGVIVPRPEDNHRYARSVRPAVYGGARCEHGHPDVPCVQLYDDDESSRIDLQLGAIREFRAAELARRYQMGPTLINWIRPCPRCRTAFAIEHKPLLEHELGGVARALHDEINAARKHLENLHDDLRWLHEAFAELEDITYVERAPYEVPGFVYLIGHERAVKIGWSAKHPARGRLSQLQAGHDQRLELLGLIEGTISTERELHKRFSDRWLSGEWFERHEDILAHFREHGIAV
jgi:hypothetical protein